MLPDADVAEYLDARFAADGRTLSGALDGLLETAAGHPQRTMLLAHFVWEKTPRGAVANEEAFAAALDQVMRVEVADELRAVWTRVSETQRRVLAAVSDDVAGLYSAATRARVGGARGGYLKQSVRALLDSGDLLEDPSTRTGNRLVDPLLALWVRGRADAG